MLSTKNLNLCSACNSHVVYDHRRGQIKCIICGLLKEDRFIDQTSEYRCFAEANDDGKTDPRRVGAAVNIGMDSQIDLIEIKDGPTFKGRQSYLTYSLQSNMDRTYNRAVRCIKKFCSILDLKENVLRQSEDIFSEIQDKKGIKGKRLDT